jgi:SAM-dependent methyltransferase
MNKLHDIIFNLLSHSFLYDLLQTVLGTYNYRKKITLNTIKNANSKVLDLGCGTANILNYIKIKHCNYFGIDFNKKYIKIAKKRFPKANFATISIKDLDIKLFNSTDYVLLFAFIHHLNDSEVCNLLKKIKNSIKKNCEIITIDPVFVQNEIFVKKFLKKLDRGKFIRYDHQYKALFKKFFNIKKSYVHKTLWPPCDNFISVLKPI